MADVSLSNLDRASTPRDISHSAAAVGVFTRIADYVRLAGLAQDVADPRVEAGSATVTEQSDTGCS